MLRRAAKIVWKSTRMKRPRTLNGVSRRLGAIVSYNAVIRGCYNYLIQGSPRVEFKR